MGAKGPDFLVVGLQRSGTHWVAALLNAHPDISCFPTDYFDKGFGIYNREIVGEVYLFNTLASLEPDAPYNHTRPLEEYLTKHNLLFADLVPYKDKVSKTELYGMFIERYNKICEDHRQGKKLVGESTSDYVFHLNFIDSLYPGIKKLCIIREPKDKIVSRHFNMLRKGKKTETHISDEFIIDYCQTVIQKEYESLLAYSGNIHCFTYEQLSQEPQQVLKSMLEYLEVSIDNKIIEHMIAEGDFKKMSANDGVTGGRERGQELVGSVYRKGIVGDWENHLTQKQVELVDELVGEIRKKVLVKHKLL